MTSAQKIETIGIIGGGQLGSMMTDAAHKLGLKTAVLDPDNDCPCSAKADLFICAAYNDEQAIETLCKSSGSVTYEFENVPYHIVQKFEKTYHIPQGAIPLYASQNRIREKQNAKQAGLNVGDFASVASKSELDYVIKKIGYPCVIKTTSFGYDGKGQAVLLSSTDLNQAKEILKSGTCILEKFINFDCEASVIAIKNKKDEITFMPIARNIHKNGILQQSIVPSGLSKKIMDDMKAQTKQLMAYLNIDGILAIEFFICKNIAYFNEMAPRPHNSGHYSIEGCKANQFDQMIRYTAGLPFSDNSLLQPTVMVNILGQHVEKVKSYQAQNAFLHMYGKKQIKYNRKMGHITFVGQDVEILIVQANAFIAFSEEK